jgi:plastocyanin
MRHLFLIGLLAGTALACQNAADPQDAGSPALSEASDAAHLDLRDERASLIQAGNALSAAIGSAGVAAGLSAAFADDVLLLSPRVDIISGAASATTFLTSNPLAPLALSWHVLVAEVSNDATQGYTWSEGSSTFDFGAGAAPRPSFFLTYWTRQSTDDDWSVAAMVVNAGGPQSTPIPDGFGTPTNKHRRTFPNTEVSEQSAAILGVDAAFSAASVTDGLGPAFEHFAAPNAIGVAGEFLFGPAALGVAFASEPGDTVTWIPRYSDVAASGDLGFSVGEATFDLVQVTFYSKYLTVWQKQNTGEWRYVADFGNSRPAPTP